MTQQYKDEFRYIKSISCTGVSFLRYRRNNYTWYYLKLCYKWKWETKHDTSRLRPSEI